MKTRISKSVFCNCKNKVLKELGRLIDTLDEAEGRLTKDKDVTSKNLASTYSSVGVELAVCFQENEHITHLEALAFQLYVSQIDLFFISLVKQQALKQAGVLPSKDQMIEQRLRMKGDQVD